MNTKQLTFITTDTMKKPNSFYIDTFGSPSLDALGKAIAGKIKNSERPEHSLLNEFYKELLISVHMKNIDLPNPLFTSTLFNLLDEYLFVYCQFIIKDTFFGTRFMLHEKGILPIDFSNNKPNWNPETDTGLNDKIIDELFFTFNSTVRIVEDKEFIESLKLNYSR